MAAGDALDSQPDALEHAVALYGLEGVFGACGGIDAMASQEGRDDPLVPPDGTKTPPLQGWMTLCADTAHLCAESLEQGGERLCDLRRIKEQVGAVPQDALAGAVVAVACINHLQRVAVVLQFLQQGQARQALVLHYDCLQFLHLLS